MPIHASERRRNVTRTILVALAAVDLNGAMLLPDGDERAPGSDVPSWVRVSIQEVRTAPQGRVSSARAFREDLLFVAECWCRGNGGEQIASVDTVDGIAEMVRYWTTARDLSLVDYVADPTGATPVTGCALRFHKAPEIVRLDPLDGYQRRLVRAEFVHFSRHTG